VLSVCSTLSPFVALRSRKRLRSVKPGGLVGNNGVREPETGETCDVLCIIND
jgi:hypothetical protein